MICKTQTEQYLREVELPVQTKTYTVIPHGDIIDQVRKILEDAGFQIELELYKASDFGREAVGFMKIYKESDNQDLDIEMTFNWTNSYNKKLRFSCGIGGYIKENDTPFITSAKGTHWKRKHSGTALDEAKETIQKIVEEAYESYNEIIEMKKKFQYIPLTRKQYAKLIGLLFFDKKVLFPEQANLIRNEYDKPSFNYQNKETLWCLYQMIMHATKEQAPSKWYQQQLRLNSYIQLMYGTATEEELVIPNKEDVEGLVNEDKESKVESTDEELEVRVLSEDNQGLLIVDFSGETPVTVHSILPKKSSQTVLPTEQTDEEETVLDESEDEEFEISDSEYDDDDLTIEEDIDLSEEEEEVILEANNIPTIGIIDPNEPGAGSHNPDNPQLIEEQEEVVDTILIKLKAYITSMYKISDPNITYRLDETGEYYIIKNVDTREITTISTKQISEV